MGSKKIEELANGAEKDIEILNEMYEKYDKYAKIREDDIVIDSLCFNLFNAQANLEEWVSYNKNK